MKLKNVHEASMPFLLLILLIASITLSSCDTTNSDQDEDNFENGISPDIRSLVGEELLASIENDLQVPIYRGSDPPEVIPANLPGKSNSISSTTVTALMDPSILLATTVPEESALYLAPGYIFAPNYVRFGNQDNENYTINFDRTQPGIELFFGPESFIIGEGDNFTVFGPQESIINEDTVKTINVFSGTAGQDGISNSYYAAVMLDNAGIQRFIPNDTGRSLRDDDGESPFVSWPGPESAENAKERNSDLNHGFLTWIIH